MSHGTKQNFGAVLKRLVLDLLEQFTESAIDIQQGFRPDFIAVETNQFQELLADDMVRRGQECGIILPIVPVENMVSMVVRIRRLTPLLSQRRLRFKSGSKGAKLSVE
jgi:hypothetical protein